MKKQRNAAWQAWVFPSARISPSPPETESPISFQWLCASWGSPAHPFFFIRSTARANKYFTLISPVGEVPCMLAVVKVTN